MIQNEWLAYPIEIMHRQAQQAYAKFILFLKWKGECIKFCFYLASGEMNEEDLEALRANMNILMTILDVCHLF